ncbi:fructosamine-3-kinase isoform X2 [Daphnia magna]|uniref:fructosamine-3-kinase isoform X2 n=1 Tax=Daphnia magna TaxID=35525 RepID=UPI001E1BB610|nr:fructosamine-3-kinase isoform X2 [Daphnia magna]
MAEVREIIAAELKLTKVEPWKRLKGGCSSNNWAFKTEIGEIFAKIDSDKHGRDLLLGEMKSLEMLQSAESVRVPRPIKIIFSQNTAILITEYIKFKGLEVFQGELGQHLAMLHLRNLQLLKENADQAVKQFGFYVNTCCGKIPVDNQWNEDWIRLKPQVEMAAKMSGNREVETLWSQLEPKIKQLFHGVNVQPSLLHGDLWSGNAGETETGPVIFDPASFYGHHEFDLAITRMFGGFGREFYKRYHQLIPREVGFEERKSLYELFHYLNHWNHFGGAYEEQSLKIMRRLVANS